jgi:cell division protein FtsL
MQETLLIQIVWLFILAIPIACIAWTVTHEEVFREPREYCTERSKTGKTILTRKFFYLFTCEYCFSHYVTAAMIFFTGYKLLLYDWRGYVIAGFALVWIANVYMSLFGMIRTTMKVESLEAKIDEKKLSESSNDSSSAKLTKIS